MLMQQTEEAIHLDGAEIASLAEERDAWCVSIYLPTHECGKEVRQGAIRLKNHLREAAAQLEALGADSDEAGALLKPLEGLCDFDTDESRDFWNHQASGLGILIADGYQRLLKLRQRPEEQTIVARRFGVRPLMRAAQREGEYSLVAVSRGAVRYFEGAQDGLTETEVDDLPDSIRGIVGGEHQKGFNLHSFQSAGGKSGGEEAVPHGHVDKDEFESLRRYFKEIAEALADADGATARPIAFAGVDELFPYFRDAAEEAKLLVVDQRVTADPEDSSPGELHDRAWPIVEERINRRIDEHVERYVSQAHTDLTSNDLEQIVIAATEGRVELLLVDHAGQALGKLDPKTRSVEHAPDDPQSVDLIDLAAAKTLATGGGVLVLPTERFEFEKGGAAALFRYTAS